MPQRSTARTPGTYATGTRAAAPAVVLHVAADPTHTAGLREHLVVGTGPDRTRAADTGLRPLPGAAR